MKNVTSEASCSVRSKKSRQTKSCECFGQFVYYCFRSSTVLNKIFNPFRMSIHYYKTIHVIDWSKEINMNSSPSFLWPRPWLQDRFWWYITKLTTHITISSKIINFAIKIWPPEIRSGKRFHFVDTKMISVKFAQNRCSKLEWKLVDSTLYPHIRQPWSTVSSFNLISNGLNSGLAGSLLPCIIVLTTLDYIGSLVVSCLICFQFTTKGQYSCTLPVLLENNIVIFNLWDGKVF